MYARGKKSCRTESGPSSGGLGEKFLFLGYFRQINTQENAVVSYLFYSSLVLSVRYSFYGKKKPVKQSELWNIQKIKEILTQRHQYGAKNVSVIPF